MRVRRWAVGCAAILVLGSLSTACSSGDGDHREKTPAIRGSLGAVSPPPIGVIPRTDRVDELVLPVAAYQLTSDQRELLGAARLVLTNDCLRRFAVAERRPAGGGAGLGRMTRRYGVTDAATAARWGYHLAPDQGSTEHGPSGPEPSAVENLVLTGNESGRHAPPGETGATGRTHRGQPIPAGGCAGQAQRELGLADRDALGESLTTSIDLAAFDRSKTDPRLTAVFADWSTCMRAEGLSFPDPLAPLGAMDLRTAAPEPAELRTAVTDVACKRQTNVVGTWFGVESAYQDLMIHQHRDELTAIRNRIDSVLATASGVVGAPTGGS
ncbi:hypothetical protein AB0J90_17865 [Micromonospora sp. NPDC049523]|uniref:hypothetical protein n=1 Tax=Micromonospora sp. NPDC049523 TaxID=3155921 RepID=UPI003443397E